MFVTLTPDRLEGLLESIPKQAFDEYDARLSIESELCGLQLPRRGTKGRRLLDGMVAKLEQELVAEGADLVSDRTARFWRAYWCEVFWGVLSQGYNLVCLEQAARGGEQDTQ